MPTSLRPHLFPALAALLMALALAGCMGASDTPINLDTDSVERTLLAESSDGDLLERGAELYGNGQYEAAARRLRVLVDRSPGDYEAVAYLGLSLWFTGRAEEAAALWEHSAEAAPADEADFLRARAEGLRILADRLRARSFAEDFRRGKLARMTTGTVAFLPARAPAPQSLQAPELVRGLHHDLHASLLADGPLRPAPGGLSLALLAESSAVPGYAQPTEALRVARILGAEYAVTMAAWTPEDAPGVLRTRFTALATEALPLRTRRLDRARRDAHSGMVSAQIELKALSERRARCAGVQDYFRKQGQLEALVQRRDREAATAARVNRQGEVVKAREAIRRYREAQERIAALQHELREFERQADPSLDGAGRFTPEAYRALARRLNAQAVQAEEQLADATRREEEALRRAAVDWRAAQVAQFDMPLAYLSRWRMRGLEELSALMGEPAPAPRAPGPGVDALAALHRGLVAWDDGEYATAARLFAHHGLDGMPGLPASPGAGFDPLRLAALPPAELAARLERDMLRGPRGDDKEDRE